MKIVWTAGGSKRYEHIMTCAIDFYGKRTLQRLVASIKNAERVLPDNPKMGAEEPLAEGREVEYRYLVLSKPFKLIYVVYNDCIYIVDIWDTRQSPQKLASRL